MTLFIQATDGNSPSEGDEPGVAAPHTEQPRPSRTVRRERPLPPIAGGSPELDDAPEGPDSGSDGGNAGNAGPYDELLSQYEGSDRSIAEQIAKRFEGDTTKRFQEAAELRKQYEPWKESGLTDYDPTELRNLVEMFADEDTAKESVRALAEQFGLLQAEQPDEPADDELGDDDPLAAAQKLLDERLSPLEQFIQDQQQQAHLAEGQRMLESEFDRIDQSRSQPLDEAERQMVTLHMTRFPGVGDDKLMDMAYKSWQDEVTRIEQRVVAGKNGEPAPLERGGASGGEAPKPKSRAEADAALSDFASAYRAQAA